jgi:hypothetical protein
MKKLAAILIIVALTGCNSVPGNTSNPGGTTSQPAANPSGSATPLFDINGTWRYEAAGDLAAGCLTIAGQRVTSFDDGCNGNKLTIVSNQPAYASADTAGVYFSFSLPGGDPTHFGLFGFQLVLQSDGTLAGQAVKRIEPSGPIGSGNVVWKKQ